MLDKKEKPKKTPIDNKLTQHILDPLQDSHSCQLTTMGAHQCHMDGAHIQLTTAMPRDTLKYNKHILRRVSMKITLFLKQLQ